MITAKEVPEAFTTLIQALPIYSNVFVYIDAIVIKMPNERIANKYSKEAEQIIKNHGLPLKSAHKSRSNSFFIKLI